MLRKLAPILVLVLVACTTTPADLIRTAQTPAQYAFALYGTFVVTEEAAAGIVENPGTPPVVVAIIRTADAIAKPAADTMLEAARAYVAVNARLKAGDNGVSLGDVSGALSLLITATQRAGPSIDALVKAIQNL